jgi:amino-acid N-acetyltransferase
MQVLLRRAYPGDADAIAELVNGYAAEDIMLPRTPEQVLAAVDDYVVACDVRGRLLACGALREYSPSCAELVSLAVARAAHGRGLGRVVVAEVERLARKRGFDGIFAHTLTPAFFEACGYDACDRGLYPEKRARPHTACMQRSLVERPEQLAVAA